MKKIVIVGGGFGGLRAARELGGAEAEVTVIDRSNHHLFQPLLYQVATAALSPADIAVPIRSVLRRQKNTSVVMADVTGVNVSAKTVQTSVGDFPFDYLVLATGAKHGYFGHDDWEPFAPGLKGIPDALEIRTRILSAFERAEVASDDAEKIEWLTFVIVGGGPTGVELAGAISELSYRALASDFRHIDPKLTRVLLIEAGARILGGFPESLSQSATAALQKLNVEVMTGARVEEIRATGVKVSGQWIPARTMLWAAGVVASPVGKWLGCETDRSGRVVVKEDLSIPGHPDIFVIGDVAAVAAKGGKILPGVAPVAMQEGVYVGKLLARRIEGKSASEPFLYFDKGNLATVGRKFAIADIWGLHLTGFIAWVTWLFVHIFYLIGFRNRLLVLIQWGWAYMTFQRGARLISEPKK